MFRVGIDEPEIEPAVPAFCQKIKDIGELSGQRHFIVESVRLCVPKACRISFSFWDLVWKVTCIFECAGKFGGKISRTFVLIISVTQEQVHRKSQIRSFQRSLALPALQGIHKTGNSDDNKDGTCHRRKDQIETHPLILMDLFIPFDTCFVD